MARGDEDLRFIGIHANAGRLTLRCRRILRLTAFFLIFLLSAVFVAHDLLLRTLYDKISDLLVLKALLFILDKSFSVLAKSGILYAAAAAHTIAGEITCTGVVPRALQTLFVTFHGVLVCNTGLAVFIIAVLCSAFSDSSLGTAALVVLLIWYSLGLLYLTVVLQLAVFSVIVVGDYCGFMSRGSTKGRMMAAVVLLVKAAVCWLTSHYVFGWDYIAQWTTAMDALIEANIVTWWVCIVLMELPGFGMFLFYAWRFYVVMFNDGAVVCVSVC